MGYGRQYSDWGKGEPTEGMWYRSSIVLRVETKSRTNPTPKSSGKMGSVSGGSG